MAFALSGVDTVMSVGSTNRRDEAADIAASADYTEVAAPGGQRGTEDPKQKVWSTGGDSDYTPSTGGCMAAGFAGGVAALVVSRFPGLTNDHLRQVLRNTARGHGWDPCLGWGILDAAKGVSLPRNALCQRLRVNRSGCGLARIKRRASLRVSIRNRGAFDVNKALVAAFNGDPRRPAAPRATTKKPAILVTRQLGHAIGPVRGLHGAVLEIELASAPAREVWVQVCALDRHGSGETDTVRVSLSRADGA